MKKKILIYNWITFDEKEGKGGGVTVYTKNLIEYLEKETSYEIYFLSSGRAYDTHRDDIYVEHICNSMGEQCHSYQVVNSPVLSSAHLSFPYPQDMLEDRKLKVVIKQFLVEIGGVDIIHFQNLEGLSLSVLELKIDFPNIKFVYSMHNYYPFCPQVMLWQQNSRSCKELDCGRCCIECMPQDVFKDKVIYNQQLEFDRTHNREISFERLEKQKMLEEYYVLQTTKQKYLNIYREELQKSFQNYRKKNVNYINKYMDVILAVSKRVANIAVDFGIDKNKLQVNYIGTKVANKQRKCLANPYTQGVFKICYLGFARHNKGFYFLLDALEQMSDDIAKKISVVLATKIEEEELKSRLARLSEKFASIINFHGYIHEELPVVLDGVHLGIVPSLWEDNLPQVAIEMKAYGIPVLCSDLGGAKELSKAKGYVFIAGNKEDFIIKLTDIILHKISLESYFEQGFDLVMMNEHIEALKKIYFDS